MRFKWHLRGITLPLDRKFQGFTLIETLVSLLLLMGLLLFFRPITQILQGQMADADILAVLRVDSQLDKLTAGHKLQIKAPTELTVISKDTVYLVQPYKSPNMTAMLRVTTEKRGHMPLLLDIQGLAFEKNDVIVYTIKRYNRRFEGVVRE